MLHGHGLRSRWQTMCLQHSMIGVELLFELGLVGFLLFVMVVLLFAKKSIGRYSTHKEVFALLVCLLIMATLTSVYDHVPLMALFFVAIGVLSSNTDYSNTVVLNKISLVVKWGLLMLSGVAIYFVSITYEAHLFIQSHRFLDGTERRKGVIKTVKIGPNTR